MDRRILTLAALATALSLTACDRACVLISGMTDKSDAFSSLKTGLSGHSRDRVVQLMGPPLAAESTSFAGLEAEVLSFIDANNRYTVHFVSNTAWAKKSTPRSNSTQEK